MCESGSPPSILLCAVGVEERFFVSAPGGINEDADWEGFETGDLPVADRFSFGGFATALN